MLGCGFYVWLFIFHLFDCLIEVFDFLWTVFFHWMLVLFSCLFIWSRCLVPPLIAYKWIFQDSREQEKCVRKVFLDKFSSYSLFFHISHCSIDLLYLGMICWLDLCIIELSSNMFIMFWFVRFTFHFLHPISLFVGENSVIWIFLVFSCDHSFFGRHF